MGQAEVGPGRPQTYEELLHRLEEAEDTIRAIRDGEIDALVVRPALDEQVFTLQGGSDSYRAFMETMGHGAAALGADKEVLYINGIFATLIGKPLAQLQGKPLSTQFDNAVAQQIENLFTQAQNSADAAASCEIRLKSHGEIRHYLASAEPLQTGVVNGWAVTFTDLTDRVRAEESLAAERAARAIMASANEAVVVCDVDGIITHTNAAVLAFADGDLIGKPFHQAIPLNFAETTGLLQGEELVRLAVSGTAVKGVEAHAPGASRSKDLLLSAAPLSMSEGVGAGCVITLVDLSQRKAAEKQQNLLMAELDHRVKNTLTLVLSILGRTSEKDIEAFKETFAGRIHALAATHNLLSNNSWSTLTIGEVVAAELAPYVRVASDRVEQTGPKIAMKPRAAIAMGLIFHELASNAVKYGALSSDEGKIIVTTKQRTRGAPVSIEWLERGGPKVNEPERIGFGRTVITRSLGYSPQGGATLAFEPLGIRCTISVPPEDVVN